MIKLVATDIDGTILIPGEKFTTAVINCIKKLNSNGIKVVLVTGRMHAAAIKIANELGLSTPVVSYQGGLVKLGDKILYEKYLTEEQALKLINWSRTEKIHINFYNDDVLYSEHDNDEVKKYCFDRNINYVVKPLDQVPKNKVNKVLAIDYNNAQRIDEYEKNLQNVFEDLYIVKSTPYFLEFSNKEASKYCAVKFLQKYYNLSDNEILTIGDQNNDIALLQAGGVKVAMGNATGGLKEIADYITETVDNDGFVVAIEKFCNFNN